MTWLHALGTAVPPHAHAQTTIQQFMAQLVNLPAKDQERLAHLYSRSGIQTRHSVIPDYGCPPEQRQLYPPTSQLEPFPQLSQRMACFQEKALPLALQAVSDCFSRTHLSPSSITHLIAVTCTGLSAPGLDLMLLKALDLPATTQRTGIYFMGCYAAIHGLKMADAICRSDPQAVVLMVCVELCTLHFQKEPSPDNLMANMLFADGAAASLLSGSAHQPKVPALSIIGFASQVNLDGWSDMAWLLSETGFIMRLSAYVPELLSQSLAPLLQQVLAQFQLSQTDIHHWAIHPGGRKIVEAVEAVLNLPPLTASRQVLADYGNMSSPTVLFVLQAIWQQQLQGKPAERILAAAFGPGLTVESALFQVVP